MNAIYIILTNLPLWAHWILGAIVGLSLFIVVTSDDQTKSWSAHKIGKRNNIAWLILGVAALLLLWSVIPVFKYWGEIVFKLDFSRWWVKVKDYFWIFIIAIVALISSVVAIRSRQ